MRTDCIFPRPACRYCGGLGVTTTIYNPNGPCPFCGRVRPFWEAQNRLR
jgi:hypothetical protein